MYVSGVSSTYENSYSLRRQQFDLIGKPKNNANTNESLEKTAESSNKVDEKKQKEVEELKKRDQEVKTHEQAHMNAAGPLASPPRYKTKMGPDGKQYAVGGSVSIDTSKGSTPEETISKAQSVRRAALAPKEPSAQDQRVAQKASQMEAQARAEMAKRQQEGMKAYGISKPSQAKVAEPVNTQEGILQEEQTEKDPSKINNTETSKNTIQNTTEGNEKTIEVQQADSSGIHSSSDELSVKAPEYSINRQIDFLA